MIKARATTDNGPTLIIGLSKANITKLHEGFPIRTSLAELGLPGELVIFTGDTEASMEAELRSAGMLAPEPPPPDM